MASTPTVYFGSVRTISTKPEHSFVGKFDAVVNKLGIKDVVKDKDVVIKMHLGSNLGFTTVHPFLVGRLVSAIKSGGGKPYIVDIIEQYPDAVRRGYTPEVLGCPILPVAGPGDRYYIEKEVNYKGLKTLQLGGNVKDADVLVDLSHVKAHNTVGYGAAIKNLAVGCFTQKTRWAMHDTMHYDKYWHKEKSRDALNLVKACPFGAISYKDEKLVIDFDSCNQCMRCVMADTDGCLQIKPENFLSFAEINAISAKFVLSHFDEHSVFFINVATEMTVCCDCWGVTTGEILPDLGILGSRDIIAVDKASLDLLADMPLIKENVSQNLEVNDDPDLHPFARMHGPYKDPYNVIAFAEKYGLGSSNYTLEEVLPPVPSPKRKSPEFPKPVKPF